MLANYSFRPGPHSSLFQWSTWSKYGETVRILILSTRSKFGVMSRSHSFEIHEASSEFWPSPPCFVQSSRRMKSWEDGSTGFNSRVNPLSLIKLRGAVLSDIGMWLPSYAFTYLLWGVRNPTRTRTSRPWVSSGTLTEVKSTSNSGGVYWTDHHTRNSFEVYPNDQVFVAYKMHIL